MENAAVIIPTLNREKHLRRCVESLINNKEAGMTDLYISVDYPPSDKYRDGYVEVIEYVKTITGFATVNLYFQEKNLGPGLNRKYLEQMISEKHDKYVFTDDDNEFSENFLAYINWGLEKYKDDELVYAICSTSDFDICKNGNKSDYLMIPAYNPYGVGHWLHKNKKCAEYLKQESLNQIYKTKEKQRLLYHYSPMVYMWVANDSIRRVSPMRGRDDSLTYIDIWENVYCIENKMTCIIPAVTKSRNWGLDGSGVHENINDVADYVPCIELDYRNEWTASPIRFDKDTEELNRVSHKEKFSISKKEIKTSNCLYVLNSILGNALTYGVFKIIKSLYKKIFKKDSSDKNEIMYG